MITHQSGVAPPSLLPTTPIPMDGWEYTNGNRRLTTAGVADCLVMIMHNQHANSGSLTHISWPLAANSGPQHDHYGLKVLRHTAHIRDLMLNRMACAPYDVEVILWRGIGFSSDVRYVDQNLSGNLLNNLSWSHFRTMFDFTDHGGTLPYQDCTAVTYDPTLNQVWFHN